MPFANPFTQKIIYDVDSLSYEERMALWILRSFPNRGEIRKKLGLKHLFGKDFEVLEKMIPTALSQEKIEDYHSVLSINEAHFLSIIALVQHGSAYALHHKNYQKFFENYFPLSTLRIKIKYLIIFE